MASVTFYLTVEGRKSYGGYSLNTPRTTKTKPKTNAAEVSLEVTLNLPDILFERPALHATIEVSDEKVSAPAIEAEVIDNIAEIVKEQTGIELTIHQPED